MATVVLILTSAAACSSSAGTMSGTSGPGPTATTGSGAGFHLPVSHPTVWLCRPGMTINPCAGNLDTTVVAPDGTGSAEGFRPAATPKIDCFYVYPTLSEAASINAPLAPEPEAVAVTRAQVGRFASLCRLFVPVYRQITLRGLGLALGGQRIPPAARTLAAEDVASAWHDYLNHDNAGRGVLLIGHSQGAIELIALISTELDKNPAERALLVSAILPGGNLLVPAGRDVGGDFQTIPACRTPTQHAC
ncbi:MAG: DUF3089 domain-containing protein, partial [Frankiaceae bacterium]